MLSIVTVASCAWRHLIDLIGFLVKVTERQQQSFVQTSAYTSIFKGQSAECLYAFQGSSVTLRGHVCHVNKRPPPVGTGTCLVALSDEAGPAGARPGRVLTPLPPLPRLQPSTSIRDAALPWGTLHGHLPFCRPAPTCPSAMRSEDGSPCSATPGLVRGHGCLWEAE